MIGPGQVDPKTRIARRERKMKQATGALESKFSIAISKAD
jgi:hypothetical protein